MTATGAHVFLAGGQNTVPFAGRFLGGWSAGPSLAFFWCENPVPRWNPTKPPAWLSRTMNRIGKAPTTGPRASSRATKRC